MLYFSIKDIANDLNVSIATVRNKVNKMAIEKQPNGRLLLTKDQYNHFLYIFYPALYAKSNGCVLSLERTLKKMKNGKIQKIVQKSGKTYWYIRDFPIGYDKDGNVIKYKHSTGYTSKAEAIAARKLLIIRRSKGELIDEYLKNKHKDEPTYCDYVLSYITKRKQDWAYNTWLNYERAYRQYIRPYFKDTTIKGLNVKLLDAFAEKYLNMRWNCVRGLLHLTLTQLYKHMDIKEDLYSLITFPRITVERYDKKPLTTEELHTLFNYYKGKHFEYVIHLHFKTGLRRGELQALQWDDIELNDEYQIVVNVQYSWGLTETGYARKDPKTKSSKRTVVIYDEYLWQLLKKAKETVGTKCKWVVCNKRLTGVMDPITFNAYYYRKVGRKLGIKLSTHIARHTFISHSIAAGIQLENIAKMVGHSNTAMICQVYGKVIAKQEDWYKGFRLV